MEWDAMRLLEIRGDKEKLIRMEGDGEIYFDSDRAIGGTGFLTNNTSKKEYPFL